MDPVTFAAALDANPASWAQLRVGDLTPAQLAQLAAKRAAAIPDLRDRTAALVELGRTLASEHGVGVQRDVREALTATLHSRLATDPQTRKVDLAGELGIGTTRLKQVLAGNQRSPEQKAAETARRQEVARITQVLGAVRAELTGVTPQERKEQMLEARRRARASERARRVAQIEALVAQRPGLTNSQIAQVLSASEPAPADGSPPVRITRHMVTGWLTAAGRDGTASRFAGDLDEGAVVRPQEQVDVAARRHLTLVDG